MNVKKRSSANNLNSNSSKSNFSNSNHNSAQTSKRESTKSLSSDSLEDLKCVICLDILEGAVETSCGHAFCGQCLFTTIKCGKGFTCPTCRAKINQVYPSFALV